jgi:hypothetical protein
MVQTATTSGGERGPWVSRAEARDVLRVLAFTLASAIFIASLNAAIAWFFNGASDKGPWVISAPFLGATAVALVFFQARYDSFAPVLSVSIRSSAIALVVYLIVEPPDFTLANPAGADLLRYIQVAYPVAIALGALGILRPAFVIPVFAFILSTRLSVERISGLGLSMLDIRYMLDMALYLVVAGLFVTRLAPRLSPWFADPKRQIEIACIGFAMHLANYFWSGVGKLLLGPAAWTWVIENPTHHMMPYAIENGALPIAQWPWLVYATDRVLDYAYIPLNIAVLGFQLFALVCVLRPSWLKVSTLFYDLFHIGIYVLGGLMFWPWIWNNLTVLRATQKHGEDFPTTAKIACIFAILLGNTFFASAWLAWWDVTGVRTQFLEAVTPQGSVRVPTAFFLSHSYSISHGYLDQADRMGHFGYTIWESAKEYDRLKDSKTCAITPAARSETPAQRQARWTRNASFLKAHHQKMLERERAWGRWNYYFRSHHHPSNPMLFPEFNALRLSDVIAYDMKVQSVCYDLGPNGVEKRVLKTEVERYPL